MNFGEYLKKKREEKGFSQSELSELADLDRTYISMLEREIKTPTIKTLVKIGKALQIKPSDMLKEIGL
jgi:transcriptional regulator with XRE-family HTH domain